MTCGIHQPNFLPFLGYFHKMAKSDIFVLLDTVQYTHNGFTNRVKIKTPQGEKWLTVPVKKSFPQLIKDVEIAGSRDHIKTIQMAYQKSPYFDYLFPELKEILERDWKYLSELNIELIKLLKEKLGIKTRLEVASDYDFKGKSTDLLIDICEHFGADTYLSGKGGADYQDEKKFKGIKLEYTDFVHPTYPQLWGEFISGLSVIDYIFSNKMI